MVTQTFWELYLPLPCPNLLLSSLSQTFLLIGWQAWSVPLSELQNMDMMYRKSLAWSMVKGQWRSWVWF